MNHAAPACWHLLLVPRCPLECCWHARRLPVHTPYGLYSRRTTLSTSREENQAPRFCRYKTYDELYGYCYKVAGTVALMTTPVMGINPEYTVRPPTHQQDKQLGHSHENEK